MVRHRCIIFLTAPQLKFTFIIIIITLGKPTITRTYPERLVVYNGNQASAFCAAYGLGQFNLTWRKYKPGTTLSNYVRFFEKEHTNGSYYYKQNIIIFEKLAPQDVGVYACVAENNVGKITRVIQVFLQGEWNLI